MVSLLYPILLPQFCVQRWCPHITKDVKLLERDQRMPHTKKIQQLENKPYNGKFNLPQLLREKVWNGLLLCVEGLARGKDIRACRAEGNVGNLADKGKTSSSGGILELLDKLNLEIRCSFLAVIKHLNS